MHGKIGERHQRLGAYSWK